MTSFPRYANHRFLLGFRFLFNKTLFQTNKLTFFIKLVVLDVELFLLEHMFIQGLEILQLNQPRFPINSLKNLIPVLHIHDLLLQTGNHNGQTKEYILLLPLNLHDELIPEELRDVEIQELKSKCVDELFYQNHYHSSLFGHLDIYDLF